MKNTKICLPARLAFTTLKQDILPQQGKSNKFIQFYFDYPEIMFSCFRYKFFISVKRKQNDIWIVSIEK